MMGLMRDQSGQRPSGFGYAQHLVNLGKTLAGGNGGWASKLMSNLSPGDHMLDTATPINTYNVMEMLGPQAQMPPFMQGGGGGFAPGGGFDPIAAARISAQIPAQPLGMGAMQPVPLMSFDDPAPPLNFGGYAYGR